jgi:hypothetical protein
MLPSSVLIRHTVRQCVPFPLSRFGIGIGIEADITGIGIEADAACFGLGGY